MSSPATRAAPRSQTPERPPLRRPPVAPKPAPGGTDWGPVADWYDQLVGESGSEYHQKVVIPGVMRLLKPKVGEKILDVGCGQGVLCRLLHEKGAAPVGVDLARELVELGRKRSGPDIPLYVGDARNLPSVTGLEPGMFDAATSMLAVQNIDPLPPVFKSIAWALRPGGRVVVVIMHPAFRGPKATSWGWDPRGVQYRRVDRYLVPRREPIISHPGKKDGSYTWSFHRPISAYIRALASAGLLLDAMEEWTSHKISAPGARARAENTARREIPMFMAMRAVKVGETAPPQPPAGSPAASAPPAGPLLAGDEEA